MKFGPDYKPVYERVATDVLTDIVRLWKGWGGVWSIIVNKLEGEREREQKNWVLKISKEIELTICII